MQPFEPLLANHYYHIYNRGVNGENLFKEERNYEFFLNQYVKYIEPIASTYAYCLLNNHFHLVVKIRELTAFGEAKAITAAYASQQFGHFFNSYTQSINRSCGRTGALFETPFKRKLINSENQLVQTIAYVHFNPVKHGFVEDVAEYPYSSFKIFASLKSTRLQRNQVFDWFGSRDFFFKFHKEYVPKKAIDWFD